MGGLASEVVGATSHVALESAWFVPGSVRATSRKLGLKTEASARFERGADITSPVRALGRALELFERIGAGAAVGGISDVYPRVLGPRHVALSRERLARLLGDRIPDADVLRILGRLGFQPSPAPDGWQVTVPAFRVDVSREADLIEEVGRHWGFDRIPATFPSLHAPPREMSPVVARDRLIRRVLCGAGLQEACTFTFMEKNAAEAFAGAAGGLVEILNPLSEKFAVLRPSLLPGLLDALVYSRRRETEDVRLFEAGAAFLPTGEVSRVGWVMTGRRSAYWGEADGPVDFFDAKGVAELLAEAFGTSIVARATETHPWFVRGRSAELFIGDDATGPRGATMGSVGQLTPELVEARGLGSGASVFGGEIDPSALLTATGERVTSIAPLPRYPSIVRDLSIFVGERLPAADLRGTIRSVAPSTLVSVREFDRYAGKGVPDGQISLSMRLTFRDRDRTLTDAEVQRAVDTIVAALASTHGAVLRGR